MKISIASDVEAAVSSVRHAWVSAEDIVNWNYAIDEWCGPVADFDLVAGRKFNNRMAAKDGSMGFDFTAEFPRVIPEKLIIS